ncbi:CPBP family intramembrane glutamic endopeptidase [Halalkalirubrum salinum]|uniref:CPBP family intramembrane glutamic endopeptidase n=1 Tax=Halalkalirubrum salinum TaxID=2563889 RepID=UPI0010FB63E4|nr:type II CAAX endopeptidase family protein [Halalkalirubrum salinum]
MTAWTAFTAVSLVLLLLLLGLARASSPAVTRSEELTPTIADDRSESTPIADDRSKPASTVDNQSDLQSAVDDRSEPAPPESSSEDPAAIGPPAPEERVASGSDDIPSWLLLANVLFTHGLFAGLLVSAIWLAAIPLSAIGVDPAGLSPSALALGTATGVVLYVLNEMGASHAEKWGLSGSERLRTLLAPESIGGWIVLLVVVLPVIAGFEELLFRGVLIGAMHTGFGVSPWLLAIGSSVAFGLGHGAQGKAGIAVTGSLGFALAWLFIVTDSLVAVFLAHYIVNAFEFVVHEGFGADPFSI